MKIYLADDKILDFDKAIQNTKTYPDGEIPPHGQAESQLGGSQWSDEDWRILDVLGLCGVLLRLTG